jgi:hypothetical protein
MTTVLRASLADGLAAVLRGEAVSWPSLGVEPAELLAFCAEEDLTGLVHHQLGKRPDLGWPDGVRDALAREARAATAQELLRRREVVTVLDALGARDVHPILLKGTPLAYTVYEAPSLRLRSDTDLLVQRAQTETVRSVMAAIGYAATNFSDGDFLFRQFELRKDDAFGVTHAFDIHWTISTESVFSDFLGYDELASEAMPVPALGPHARAPGAVHALLLACVHPVMHHRNAERLVWLYDIRLLAARLSCAELDRFAALAARKGVAAICAHELRLARSRLGTPVPDAVIAALGAPGNERSASYLDTERRWKDELLSNVRGVSRWTDRLRLLREVALPAPGYMLRAYRLNGTALGGVLLPALYVHRGVRGIWKVLRNRK